jgi:copper transport protein
VFRRCGPGLTALGRRSLAVLGTTLITALCIGVGPADAHATLTSSSPADGAVVDVVPAEVVLTFDEAVRPLPGRMRVLGPDGTRADFGDPGVLGPSVRIALRTGGAKGTYVVSYAVVSSDNHPVDAAYTFFVGKRPTTETSDTGFKQTSGGWPDVALPIVRSLGYLGLSLLVGAALVLGSLWPRRADRGQAARVMWAGAVIIAGTTMIEFGLEILIASGGGAVRWSDLQTFLTGRSGLTHAARLAVLPALAGVLGPITRGNARKSQKFAATALLTAGMASYALAGHPGETQAPLISVLADGLHIAAMSLWLGGLIMLIIFVLPRAADDELSMIVPLWSTWAGYAVFTLVLTGIAQSILQIGTLSLLLDTGYGRLVLAKAGLLAVILLIALGSRRMATAMAQSVSGGAPRLRRLVTAESAGVLVILAVTAVLVQTPPARAAEAAKAATSATTLRMTSAVANVQLTIDPARRGLNRLDLHAVTPDGAPAHVKVWSGTASRPERGMKGLDLGLLALTSDHAVGQVRLPATGTWRLTLTVVDANLDSATMTSSISLK